jgi:hypothetical protein
MKQYEIILPIAILVLAFLLKLFIDREVKVPILIRAIYELPINIVFLALSFLIGYTITSTDIIIKNECLLFSIVITMLAIFNVVLWRRSLSLYERGNRFISILLTVLNYSLSIFLLFKVILDYLNK